MMGYKKYLLLFISLVSYFAFASNVDAALCDKEHINQLKELANQVEVSYEYIDYSDEIYVGDGEFVTNSYLITVNLISDELYVINNNREYYYNQDNGGVVTFAVNSGRVNLSIHSYTCAGYKIRSETINLPKFNTYSYRSECEELKEYDLDVCDPWYQGKITDERFNRIIQEYSNNVVEEKSIFDNISDFLKDNYLILISCVIVIVAIIVGVRLYKKRSVLE